MLVTLVQMEAQEPWETHTEQDFEVAKLSERKPNGAPTRQDSGTPGGRGYDLLLLQLQPRTGPQSRFDGYLWVQIVIMWLQTHTPGTSLAHSGPICFSPEAASQDAVSWESPLHTFLLTLSDAWWGHHLGLCADDCALRFWQQLPGPE